MMESICAMSSGEKVATHVGYATIARSMTLIVSVYCAALMALRLSVLSDWNRVRMHCVR